MSRNTNNAKQSTRRRLSWPVYKMMILVIIILVYVAAAFLLRMGVERGVISKAAGSGGDGTNGDDGPDVAVDAAMMQIQSRLDAAESFFDERFVRDDGHIMLYLPIGARSTLSDNSTNSEAISYYLLWTAQQGDKQSFDKALTFVEQTMMHPRFGYMMWHIESNGSVINDGSNMASDADLRTVRALMIAQQRWKENRYSDDIDRLGSALELMAITKDDLFAPYAGVSGENSTWIADEIWISYADFVAFRELEERRGPPWDRVYDNMKSAVLSAQLENGLYNSQITPAGAYGNGIDNNGYSVNSLWIMVRAAESGDEELMASARKSLDFYKQKYVIDAQLYSIYSSNGDALSSSSDPWVYALVARSALALDDREFASEMIDELLQFQLTGSHEYNGAFIEGYNDGSYVGQFTMQESILTLQRYVSQQQ